MTVNVTSKKTCVLEDILDGIASTAFKLRVLSDEQLTRLIQKVISDGIDTVSSVIDFVERHGGYNVAVRVAKLLRRHGPYGLGTNLWNRIQGDRLVLVEGSDA